MAFTPRVAALVGLALAAACGDTPPAGSGPDAAVPPECDVTTSPGGYTLHIVAIANGTSGAFPFDLSADGTFSAYMPRTFESCDGALTPDEGASLAAAVNTAAFFCRGDAVAACPESDRAYLDVSIDSVDGAHANRFCWERCDLQPDPTMDEFRAIGQGILNRVYLAGGCARSTFTPPPQTDRCPPP